MVKIQIGLLDSFPLGCKNYCVRVFQADELLEEFGTAAADNIKEDYGKNADITGLWNTTMDTVCNSAKQVKI